MKKEINWDEEEKVYLAQQRHQEVILINSDDSSDETEPATPVHSTRLQSQPRVKRSRSDSDGDSGESSEAIGYRLNPWTPRP